MKRRDFITLLGGAAAWPLTARAQQREMRRIGVLTALASDDPEGQARLAAFAQGLQQSGWTVGQNVRVDYRWSGGNADNMRKYAAELVALAPDVILASAVLDMPSAFVYMARTVRDHRFQPHVYWLGMREGIVSLAWNARLKSSISPRTIVEVARVQKQIREGTFQVPRGKF